MLLLSLVTVAWAGQIPSHIYTSMQGRTGLTGPAKRMVDENLTAYLTGAQGPDTIGIIQYELQAISMFESVGDETHYSPKKALLAFNILAQAKTDAQRAYALGWLTHYVNDIYVHPMVNNYGGFYGVDPKHHKVLEQIETKYVFAAHGNVVNRQLATTIPSPPGDEFAGFILDAYHETYPEVEMYDPKGLHWGGVDNRSYFGEQANKAAKWCLAAEQGFYQAHDEGIGYPGLRLANVPLPSGPSKTNYQRMLKAVEVADITTQSDALLVTVKINDSKLYGRFLMDWESNSKKAIEDTKSLLALASTYVANPTPDTRMNLLKRIPNVNLDQPLENYDNDAVFPGNITVKNVAYRLTVQARTANGQPMGGKFVVNGASNTQITYGEELYYDMRAGTVTFRIPFGGKFDNYSYTLQVALSGKEAFDHPDYKDVDWTQADGEHPGSWMNNVGRIGLGQIFKVTVPIPAKLRGKDGMRRWLIIKPDHELNADDLEALNLNITTDDWRADVAVLNETFTPDPANATSLTSTLQIYNMGSWGQQNLDEGRLALIWSEHATPEDFRGREFIEKASDEMIAANTKLMEHPNYAKLMDILKAYAEELQKKGVSEADAAPLMEKKTNEALAQLGLNELNAAFQTALGGYQSSITLPFHVSAPINVRPTVIGIPLPAGWVQQTRTDNPPPFQGEISVDKRVVVNDEKGRMMWWVHGSLTLNWVLWNETELKYQQSLHAEGAAEEYRIGDFTGTLYSHRKDTERTRLISASTLLRNGQAGLIISYYLDGTCETPFLQNMRDALQGLLNEVDTMRYAFTATMEL